MLTSEEEGAVYICQIKHSSFGNIEELFYEVNLQGKMHAVSQLLQMMLAVKLPLRGSADLHHEVQKICGVEFQSLRGRVVYWPVHRA